MFLQNQGMKKQGFENVEEFFFLVNFVKYAP